MSDANVRGLPDRVFPTDAEMRNFFREFARLLAVLDERRGTLLNPNEVAEQLRAIRQRRVPPLTPKRPLPVVLKPQEDWSDLSEVPIRALGLRTGMYRKLIQAGIRTVAQVVAHSDKGLTVSGAYVGSDLFNNLCDRLAAHGLRLAADNSGIPLSYIMGRGHRNPLQWWLQEQQDAFISALGVVTLGDLRRLTRVQICTAPFGTHTLQGGHVVKVMSADNEDDVTELVAWLNETLSLYGLERVI